MGADGLWSSTRTQLLSEGPTRRTGHLAYRALIKQADLPQQLRSQNVTAWLGPNMPAVQYPVEGGEWLNVVVFIHGDVPSDFQNWNHNANAADLNDALQDTCTALQDLLNAVQDWRLWVMHDRPTHARRSTDGARPCSAAGRCGTPDAAVPGAGMAIEDAAELGWVFGAATSANAPVALQHYAANRWQRNARVQTRALRNGQIFHATGLTRWGRDATIKLMVERLLDMHWLYGQR